MHVLHWHDFKFAAAIVVDTPVAGGPGSRVKGQSVGRSFRGSGSDVGCGVRRDSEIRMCAEWRSVEIRCVGLGWERIRK